jgi:hypothetical protein
VAPIFIGMIDRESVRPRSRLSETWDSTKLHPQSLAKLRSRLTPNRTRSSAQIRQKHTLEADAMIGIHSVMGDESRKVAVQIDLP